ncbi:MAG TPA: hypothetical protein VM123_00755 [archaeon]|nr:hypothetical protein [archaeon]
MRRSLFALLALVLSFTGYSYGQKDLRFGTNMLADDNIYRNYARKGDLIFMPYASLGYGLSSGDFNNFSFGYEGDFFLFRKLSHRDFSVHQLGADYNHLWPESKNLLALGGKVEARFNPADYKYYNYTSGGLYLNYKTYLRENVVLLAGYNLNGKNFSEFSEFNYVENIFAIQTSIFFSTKTTLRLSANYYHKNYTTGISSLDSLYVPSLIIPDTEQGEAGQGGMGQGGMGQGGFGNGGVGSGLRWQGYWQNRPQSQQLLELSEGHYWYRIREDEFPSTDQLKLGITVAQNLAEGTGLMVSYAGRINPSSHNRFLANLGESVLNNEELFDDHYSYIGHEGTVQLKQMLPAQSTLTLLFTARQRNFSGRPAMDLEGYYLPGGESRLDKAFLFEAEFAKRISLGSYPLLNDFDFTVQFGAGKNSSNDEYYNYRNTYFLFSMEKAF